MKDKRKIWSPISRLFLRVLAEILMNHETFMTFHQLTRAHTKWKNMVEEKYSELKIEAADPSKRKELEKRILDLKMLVHWNTKQLGIFLYRASQEPVPGGFPASQSTVQQFAKVYRD